VAFSCHFHGTACKANPLPSCLRKCGAFEQVLVHLCDGKMGGPAQGPFL